MEVVDRMRITSGLRIGHWRPHYRGGTNCFLPLGFYYGPDLGDMIPGEKIRWPLEEGDLVVTVGVLFRPDLGKRQRLETILIVEEYQEAMWDYDQFSKESIAAGG